MNLLLAAALLLQDKAAEEAFKKIDETIAKAKTVRLKYSAEMTAEGDSMHVIDGTLLFKGEDKVNFLSRTKGQKGDEEVEIASDGVLVRHRAGKKVRSPKDPPKELAADFRTQFVRGGAFLAYGSSLRPSRKKEEQRKQYEPQNLRLGKEDADGKTLIYELKFPDKEFEFTLRYDPKTWLILSRTGSVKRNGADVGTIRESYEGITLDADIPDDKFRIANDDEVDRVPLSKAILSQVGQALDLFKLDHGRYPEKLKDLVEKPEDIDHKSWPPGGYLVKQPKDGWNRDLVYRVPGTNGAPFDLISLGEDGKEGGEGNAADLWNHDRNKKK